MNDIFDGMALVRRAFMSANLEIPSAIVLKNHDEGMRLLSHIRQSSIWRAPVGSPDLGHPIEDENGKKMMEIKVMDISIRWPANCYQLQDGSCVWS